MNSAPNEQKSILITGGSSGIGLSVARGLKLRGYLVFVTARRAVDIENLALEGFHSIHMELNDSKSIAEALGKVLSLTGGKLYALYNNAGYGQPGAVEDLSRDAIRAQFEVNVFGTQELTNLVLPIMRKQGYGRIIQGSSIFGMVSLPYRGVYCASKYALEALSDALRQEVVGMNIFVSLIEPGPIETKFRENSAKMLEENILLTDSPHYSKYQQREQHLKKQGRVVPFTLSPEAVLNKVVHALESPRPKARYFVTVPAYILAFARRLLTTKMLDRLLAVIG